MDNNKIDLLRESINSLDDKILDLLKQRAEIVTESNALIVRITIQIFLKI